MVFFYCLKTFLGLTNMFLGLSLGLMSADECHGVEAQSALRPTVRGPCQGSGTCDRLSGLAASPVAGRPKCVSKRER